jgi:hypothetical protein
VKRKAENMDFKLSDLMELLQLDETTTRKMLKDAGSDLDERAHNPNVSIPQEEVAALASDMGDTLQGRLLANLLKQPPKSGL